MKIHPRSLSIGVVLIVGALLTILIITGYGRGENYEKHQLSCFDGNQRDSVVISEIYALKPTYIRCFDTIIFPMDNPMRRHAFKGMEFYLSEKQAGIWYNKHQLTMLANHYQSYLAGYPDHNMRHKIRVIKSTEPYAALKFEGTNGHNYGITTDSLIKKLEYWNNNTLKMLVVGAQFDYVQLRIIQEPTDWEAFAKEVYAFCPDAVDQNANSDFKSFLSTMEASKSLVLWWD